MENIYCNGEVWVWARIYSIVSIWKCEGCSVVIPLVRWCDREVPRMPQLHNCPDVFTRRTNRAKHQSIPRYQCANCWVMSALAPLHIASLTSLTTTMFPLSILSIRYQMRHGFPYKKKHSLFDERSASSQINHLPPPLILPLYTRSSARSLWHKYWRKHWQGEHVSHSFHCTLYLMDNDQSIYAKHFQYWFLINCK